MFLIVQFTHPAFSQRFQRLSRGRRQLRLRRTIGTMPRPATARPVTQLGEAAVANASDGQSGLLMPVHRSARTHGPYYALSTRPSGDQARVCGAWAHGEIYVMYQWFTNRRSCAHIYTCMPTWNYFPLAVSCCNKAQCMPTDRKLGPSAASYSASVQPSDFANGIRPDTAGEITTKRQMLFMHYIMVE